MGVVGPMALLMDLYWVPLVGAGLSMCQTPSGRNLLTKVAQPIQDQDCLLALTHKTPGRLYIHGLP
jgi:hypothetical protein